METSYPTPQIEGMLRLKEIGLCRQALDMILRGEKTISEETYVGTVPFVAVQNVPDEILDKVFRYEEETGKFVYHILKSKDGKIRFLYLYGNPLFWNIQRKLLERGVVNVFSDGEESQVKVKESYGGIKAV